MEYCSTCNKSPFKHRNLLIHQRTVHEGTQRKRCEYCDGSFETQRNLARHYGRCKVLKQHQRQQQQHVSGIEQRQGVTAKQKRKRPATEIMDTPNAKQRKVAEPTDLRNVTSQPAALNPPQFFVQQAATPNISDYDNTSTVQPTNTPTVLDHSYGQTLQKREVTCPEPIDQHLPTPLQKSKKKKKLSKAQKQAVADKDILNPDPNDWREVQELQEEYDGEQGMAELLDEHWNIIRTQKRCYVLNSGVPQSIYNFNISNSNTSFFNFAWAVFRSQTTSFRANIEPGYVLRHRETGELRYYYGSYNTEVFPKADRLINNEKDFKKMMDDFDKVDLETHALQNRENTKWRFHMLTNISIRVTYLYSAPIGAGNILPKWLKRNRGMYGLEATDRGRPYKDKMCVLRALALHDGCTTSNLETTANEFLQYWCRHKQQAFEDFNGIDISEFDKVEKCFSTPIYLYELVPAVRPANDKIAEGVADAGGDIEEQLTRAAEAEAQCIKKGKFVAVLRRRPDLRKSERRNEAMYLNIYKNGEQMHCSYIHDFPKYSGSYQCSKCLKISHHRQNLEVHERTCNGAETVDQFPGNGYVIKPTIFEKLDDAGIFIPKAQHFHNYFSAFDFESCANKVAHVKFTPLLQLVYNNPFLHESFTPPDNESDLVKRNWHHLQSRVAATGEFAVIRNADLNRIEEYITAIAQLQRTKFSIQLRAYVPNTAGQVCPAVIWQSGMVHDTPSLLGQLATLTPQHFVKGLRGRVPLALRINVITKKQDFVAELQPASVAVASSVPGFTEPKFFLSDGNTERFINDFVNYLEEISDESKLLLKKRYSHVTHRLRQLIKLQPQRCKDILAKYGIPEDIPKLWPQHFADMKAQDPIWYNANIKDFFECKRRAKLYKFLLKEFESWMSVLPVLSFNGSRFDLNLVRGELLWNLQQRQPKQRIRPIVKGTTYMSIATNKLRFLDICHYLSPGFSYDSWLKAYEIPVGKAVFPHEWLVSLDCLQAPYLPPKEAFFSALKNQGITDEEYAKAQEAWRTHNMQTMADYIAYYNKLDVGPFILAAEKMRQLWIKEGLCIFSSGSISLPGLAIRSLMATLPPHTNLVMPQKPAAAANDSSDMYYRMKDNITGGPSIIFCRYAKANETRIRTANGELCAGIIGWDCNSMYLDATCRQAMPTGIPIHYKMGDNGFFKRKQTYRYAQSELTWLEWTSYCLGFKIQHKFNTGHELTIHGQHPDGYAVGPKLGFDSTTCKREDGCQKHVFYFDGCKAHGHNCFLTKNIEKLDEQKQWQDKRTRDDLKRLGYNVHEIKECEWFWKLRRNITPQDNSVDFWQPAQRDSNLRIRDFIKKHFKLPYHGKMTTAKMISEIRKDRFFGMVVCDIQVPETREMRAKFAEMTPIFKNTDVNFKDIGPHMQQKCIENELQNTFPRRCLIGSYSAKEIMLATPLIKFYLEEGLEITRIYEAWETKPKVLFEDFANKISDCRRAADKDPSMAIIAQSEKLKGNACYGKLVTAKERHRDTIICIDSNVEKFAQDPYYVTTRILSEKCAEVSMRKHKIIHDNYTAIGFFTYQYAKLKLLEFYYRFLDRFWSRDHFEMLETDTDSLYVAVADMDFEKLVKPHLREEYKRVRNQFLPDNSTPELEAYYNREPGLFKVEAIGDEFNGLNAKSYGLHNSATNKTKISCKGLPKNLNKFSIEAYNRVLTTGRSEGGDVRGFRRGPNGKLFRQDGFRFGLTYGYYKRQVTDGIHTIPLDI